MREVGFSRSCKIVRLQRTGTNGEGRKSILIVTACVVSSIPSTFPCPVTVPQHQGTSHRVFVIGLLTGTLATGHLGTEQQINFPFCAHRSAELSELPGPQMVRSLTPRAWSDGVHAPSHGHVPLTRPRERAQEGSDVCKGRDHPHAVGLWLTHVASHFGQMFKSRYF